MAPLTESVPRLHTVSFHPEFRRPAAQAYSFLKSIDSVEIRRVEVVDNVPYFVVEVFTQALHSQIPTVVQRKQLLAQHQPRSSKRALACRSREPAFVVKRSFTAFQEFQRDVCAHLDQEKRGNCQACNAWLTYITFTMTKAQLRMKILPTKTVRRHELTKFLKTAVLLSTQATVTPSSRQKCPIGDSIAETASRFLQKDSAPY